MKLTEAIAALGDTKESALEELKRREITAPFDEVENVLTDCLLARYFKACGITNPCVGMSTLNVRGERLAIFPLHVSEIIADWTKAKDSYDRSRERWASI